MSWLGTFTHFPEESNSRPWYGHLTTLPISLPIESGACRWQQRSSSATAFPESVLNRTTGSSRRTRRFRERVISWSQAATYQALRTNMSDLSSVLELQKQEGKTQRRTDDVQP